MIFNSASAQSWSECIFFGVQTRNNWKQIAQQRVLKTTLSFSLWVWFCCCPIDHALITPSRPSLHLQTPFRCTTIQLKTHQTHNYRRRFAYCFPTHQQLCGIYARVCLCVCVVFAICAERRSTRVVLVVAAKRIDGNWWALRPVGRRTELNWGNLINLSRRKSATKSRKEFKVFHTKNQLVHRKCCCLSTARGPTTRNTRKTTSSQSSPNR